MGEFSAQNLAKTAWAFVKLGWSEGLVFGVLAGAMVKPVGEFNAERLVNTA